RHLVIPYSLDTNDMRFVYGNDRVKLGTEFSAYVIDAFDWLWREGASAPKMMSIGVHLRRTGRPGRIGGLDRIFEHMRKRGGVWFPTRRDIARHWIDRFGASWCAP